LGQTAGAQVGACYTTCSTVTADSCGSGQQCTALDGGGNGFCLPEFGAGGAEGDTCTSSALNTSCQAGMQCVAEGATSVCRASCDFNGTAACPSLQACTVLGACLADLGAVDQAQIDQICTAPEGTPCGDDGQGKISGACLTDLGIGEIICQLLCDPAAPAGQDCQTFYECATQPPTFENVGVCAIPAE
jgi:hypothetical protein